MPSCVSEPIGSAEPAPREHHAGDGGRRHGAQAGEQHAQLAFGLLDLLGLLHGVGSLVGSAPGPGRRGRRSFRLARMVSSCECARTIPTLGVRPSWTQGSGLARFSRHDPSDRPRDRPGDHERTRDGPRCAADRPTGRAEPRRWSAASLVPVGWSSTPRRWSARPSASPPPRSRRRDDRRPRSPASASRIKARRSSCGSARRAARSRPRSCGSAAGPRRCARGSDATHRPRPGCARRRVSRFDA